MQDPLDWLERQARLARQHIAEHPEPLRRIYEAELQEALSGRGRADEESFRRADDRR